MNYFVEGLQGSGKSTLVQKLEENKAGFTAVREGEYSPVELAWCAYVDKKQYEDMVCFILVIIVFSLFVMYDKERVANTLVANEDLFWKF